jgi:hypothetical protein
MFTVDKLRGDNMRFTRSSYLMNGLMNGLMICVLIIDLFVPAPLLAQSGQTQRSPHRQQESLAAPISELLKLAPLPPESPDKRATNRISNASDEDKKPPADDAPIGKLIEYWSQYGNTEDTSIIQKPTEKLRYRLLEACEDRPRLLTSLLNLMPETSDACDRLHQLLTGENGQDEDWKDRLHRCWPV